MEGNKKVVYIAGSPLSPVCVDIKSALAKVEDAIRGRGFVALSPAGLPDDLGNGRAVQLRLAMIEQADAVFFAPGWHLSVIGQFELTFCKFTGKPYATDLEELS